MSEAFALGGAVYIVGGILLLITMIFFVRRDINIKC
jgi:hypothetical protein